MSRKDVKAFTLAEVLITLGIIGVIASITIPALMQNIQDQQFKEAAKKAYSVASQATTQMRQDYGTLASFYTTTDSFKPVFMKYFNIAQDCGSATCVPNTWFGGSGPSNIYKTLDGNQGYTWPMAFGQFVTNDGMFWGIYNDSTTGNICITVDVNGHGKPPNTYGRDVFLFQLINDNLLPMGAAGTWWATPTYCRKTTADPSQGFGCMAYVLQGRNY